MGADDALPVSPDDDPLGTPATGGGSVIPIEGEIAVATPAGGDVAAPVGGDAAVPAVGGDAAAPAGGDAATPVGGDAAAPAGSFEASLALDVSSSQAWV